MASPRYGAAGIAGGPKWCMMKGVDERGLVFYTKSGEPHGASSFFAALRRPPVVRLSTEEPWRRPSGSRRARWRNVAPTSGPTPISPTARPARSSQIGAMGVVEPVAARCGQIRLNRASARFAVGQFASAHVTATAPTGRDFSAAGVA